MNTNLKGKTILITGASRGIGRAVAYYLDSLGCTTILVARSKDKLEEMKNQMKSSCHIIPFDLADLDNIEKIFIKIQADNYKLDGFVHCVGMYELSTVQGFDINEVKRIMDVNFFSFLQLGKYFLKKKFSNNGASIVTISSLASLVGAKGNGQYAASKAAMNSLVKTMAQESLNRRIRVNALLPTYVETQMLQDATEKGVYLEVDETNSMPLGVIKPEEIAYMTEFLLSDCARSVTGTLIPITAGCNLV